MIHRNFRVALCLATVLIATPVFAEGPRMDPQARADKMKQELNLTDDQAVQVQQIFSDEFSKGGCRDIQNEDDRDQCRLNKRKEIHAQLAKVLTADQMKKLQDIRHERREKFHEMRERGAGPSRGEGPNPGADY